MKKLCCILLTAALILSAAACSSAQSASGKGEGGSIFTGGTSSTDSFLTENDVSNFEQDESYDEEANVQATSTPEPTSVELWYGTQFSSGKALVEYLDPVLEIYKYGIISTNGEITPLKTEVTPSIEADTGTPKYYTGHFWGEYGYIPYRAGDMTYISQFILFDAMGNVSYKTPEDSDYEVLASGEDLLLIRQTVESIAGKEVRIGIMDKDGNWICEPAVENAMSFSSLDETEKESFIYYSYHGEHVFSAYYNPGTDSIDSYLVIYNVDTGAKVEYTNLKIEDNMSYQFQFSNGESIVTSKDTIYRIQASDLSITPILENRPNGPIIYQNGVFFTCIKDDTYYVKKTTVHDGKFYNMDGAVIADLSQYTLVWAWGGKYLYRFEDGYAGVLIRAEDVQKHYLGVINKNGEFVFDPIAINYRENGPDEYYSGDAEVNALSGGVISFDSMVDDIGRLLSVSGEVTQGNFADESIKSIVFCDGYTWAENEKRYLSIDGAVVTPVLISE